MATHQQQEQQLDEQPGNVAPKAEDVATKEEFVAEAPSRLSSSDSALGRFMKDLMRTGGFTSSSSSSTTLSSIPSASSSASSEYVCIVQDHARGCERSCSQSFRRLQRECRLRRRARAINAKQISRWESYPHSYKEEQHRQETIPRRRLSPTRTFSVEAEQNRSRTRDVVHRALVEVDEALQEDSVHTKDFTPCSAWLEVIAKHGAFSPQPVHRRKTIGAHKTKGIPTAASCVPARIRRKNSGRESLMSAAQAARNDKVARSMRRLGPPRRPQRQNSLVDVKEAVMSLEQDESESPPTRPRRHSDTSAITPAVQLHHRRNTPGRAESLPKQQRMENEDEGELHEASSAEWNAICARSA